MRNKRRKVSFPDIVIIFLSIVLGISILITVHTIRDASGTYYDDESSLYYNLSDEDYVRLADRYYNTAVGNEEDPRVKKVADYYAVGRYFEKAFFANAFEKAGDTKRAELCRSQMNEIEPQMGQFASEKQKILSLFD